MDGLYSASHIIITTHRSPDGDALGSSLAMYHHLNGLGLNVELIVPDAFPTFLQWLPGGEAVQIGTELGDEELTRKFQSCDAILCLDFNAVSRCGILSTHVEKSTATKFILDHHQDPEGFHDEGRVDPSYASTCELAQEQIVSKGVLNKDIAVCLYTGILTDTGSFRFNSTTQLTHEKVSALLAQGVEPSDVYQKVHDNYSEDRTRLVGYSLYEKMRIESDLKIAIIALSAEDLKKFNYVKGDTEGLVNMPLAIAGVEISVFIGEKEGKTKISFRSKSSFDVNQFARAHFNGGGHKNAAGGISPLNASDTADKIVAILEDYRDELEGI